MTTVQFGKWKISVDRERTKEYCRDFTPPVDEQGWRNFEVFCRTLTGEERALFDQMGIDPLACCVESIGVSPKGNFPCGGEWFYCGEVTEHPEASYLSTPEEFANQLDESEWDFSEEEDTQIVIGRFELNFQVRGSIGDESPDAMPDGFSCVQFWCEKMKWLLEEECRERQYICPRFYQIGRKIRERKREREDRRLAQAEADREYCESFQLRGIIFSRLTDDALQSYRRDWLRILGVKVERPERLKKICLSNRRMQNYLWHIFSYEVLAAKENCEARDAFDRQRKSSCIIVDDIENLAYRIENAEKLSSGFIDTFLDVTLTAEDFSWVYAHTHEEEMGLGPYWHESRLLQ